MQEREHLRWYNFTPVFCKRNIFKRCLSLLVLWEMFLEAMWNDSRTLSSYISLSSEPCFRFVPFVPG